MKLAAQLFTIRDFTKTHEDIKKSLKKIKDIGYDAIQVSAFGPIKPSILKEYITEYDLKICVTHTSLDRIVNDTDKVIAEHKSWGCDYIGVGGLPDVVTTAHKKESYDAFVKQIEKPLDKIVDAGLFMTYHNHHFEFQHVDERMTGMDYLASISDPKKLKFLVDLYWVQAGGASPVQFLNQHADHIDLVHFKDMLVRDNEITMCEIFEGNMDYSEIYDACIENGVKWAVIEQDECIRDPFECLKTSYLNLQRLDFERV